MAPPDRYVPESRGGWGCAVVATPRDASKQGGQDRVRTLSAAHDLHRSGALRHTPVSSLYILANDEPTVSSLYCLGIFLIPTSGRTSRVTPRLFVPQRPSNASDRGAIVIRPFDREARAEVDYRPMLGGALSIGAADAVVRPRPPFATGSHATKPPMTAFIDSTNQPWLPVFVSQAPKRNMAHPTLPAALSVTSTAAIPVAALL